MIDTGNPASSAARDPEPSYGPDEEGEAPTPPAAIPDAADRPGAWVKTDREDDGSDDKGSDGDAATRAARPAGEAVGGIAAQPGDPTSPAAARARAAASSRAMAEDGFGDDKGGRIDRG